MMDHLISAVIKWFFVFRMVDGEIKYSFSIISSEKVKQISHKRGKFVDGFFRK
ncbi:hypothetical protein AAHB53_09660 [Niallia circulans]